MAKWTPEQVAMLESCYKSTMPIHEICDKLGRSVCSIYNKALLLGLRRPDEVLIQCGKRVSQETRSIEARFKKGQKALNKGKKMTPEMYAKCKATMFKKGNTPKNHREVGSERISKDGYIEIKVAEPNKWRLKHRLLWEQTNGKIPRGYNIQFKNKNKTDLRLENLYIISREEQMREENSYYAKYPKDMQEIIHLKAVVNRQIHKYEKNHNQNE